MFGKPKRGPEKYCKNCKQKVRSIYAKDFHPGVFVATSLLTGGIATPFYIAGHVLGKGERVCPKCGCKL